MYNSEVYSPCYIQSLQDKEIIRKSQINSADSPKETVLKTSTSNVPDKKHDKSVKTNKKPTKMKPVLKQGSYFDMKLVSLIHHECNNIQFENLAEVDFYTILNLQPTNAKLSVKANEKTRMCYLIYRLYEHLKTDNKKEWRTAILEVAGIDEKYYNSKYKEPESEIPSRKSENFAQRINRIFDNIA